MALSYHSWLEIAVALFFPRFIAYALNKRAVGRGGRTVYGKTALKGNMYLFHGEFSKSAITRHLEACEQRVITEAKAGSRQKAQQTRKLHLVVEGRDLPMYWMHLEVMASTTLKTLDQSLRNTWLECCGHLSAFEIDGVRDAIDAGMYDDWDMGEKSMRVRQDKVLGPGQTCSYEYDYGTTTELKLKMISEREVEVKGDPGACPQYSSTHLLQCVANLLLRYVPNVSMTIRVGCAMTVQRSTNVGKRCHSWWSIPHALVCAPIQDDTTAHQAFRLTLQNKAETNGLSLLVPPRSAPPSLP